MFGLSESLAKPVATLVLTGHVCLDVIIDSRLRSKPRSLGPGSFAGGLRHVDRLESNELKRLIFDRVVVVNNR